MSVTRLATTSTTEEEILLEIFSHQIAGNVTPDELQYLEEFKIARPEEYFALQSLATLWGPPVADSDIVKKSFERLIQRMKSMGIEIDDSELK